MQDPINPGQGSATPPSLTELFPNNPTCSIELPAGAVQHLVNKIMNNTSFENMKDSDTCGMIANEFIQALQSLSKEKLKGV
jgi:hypothetical protein